MIDVARAEWHLLHSAVRVRLAPTGRLISTWRAQPDPRSPEATTLRRAREVATAVRRMATYGPLRAACLTRSLAICRFLAAEGIRGSVIRIGVRPRDTRLEAHAWVEFHGEVLGDNPRYVAGFVELAATQALPAGLR